MQKEKLQKLLTQYDNYDALFFIDEAIVVDTTFQNPLLPLGRTIQQLKLNIHSFQVDGSIVIVNCSEDKYNQWIAPLQLSPLRTLLPQLTNSLQTYILSAYQWVKWDPLSQYCGQCGQLLESIIGLTEKKCHPCHLSFFPKVSVAVMVLIYRDNEVLLARSPHFRPGVYSAIAGFIERGESAEAAAHREVKEELNLEITDLTYFSSQSWPFPDSFMMAFKAKYKKGELLVDQTELEDAQWFKLNALPPLPLPASIAYQLITEQVKQYKDD